ncbi:helix-turn-helix domain-containing protein [Vagococcus lutrae]|uniref:helix-turn-helix domain-containing protein n=1 Tax=Vagococcus lutrae TaxID=81947 RepID=UPI00144420CC|nr:helix-turn-helix domain-containing protein [Vagococcus lutrae]NKZ26832.1 helix-turn-helix transcriptional regulator [Vagococcus lutrae]
MLDFLKNYKEKVLKKYFLTYLLIFLIPFIILTISLYQFSAGSYKKQIEEANLNNLAQLTTYLDNEFKGYQNTANSIRVNQKLSSFYLNHPYYSLDAKLELNKYSVNNMFVKELFIYYPQKEQFYSQHGNYDLNTLLRYKYDMIDFNEKQFYDNLTTHSLQITSDSFKENNQEALLEIFIPISNKDALHSATVVFFIDAGKMKQFLKEMNHDFSGEIFLFSNNGNLVASTSNDFSQKDIAKLFNAQGNENTINRETYVLARSTLANDSLRLMTIVNKSELYTPFLKVQVIFFLTMLVLFVIGILLSLFMSYNQYKPIQHLNTLFDEIAKKEEEQPTASQQDVLAALNQQTSHLIETNYAYNQQLQEQHVQLKSQLLTQLLEGKLDNQTIQTFIERGSLSQMAGHFCVGLIGVRANDTLFNVKFKSILMATFPLENEDVYIEAVELPFKKEYIAIIIQFSQKMKNTQRIEKLTLNITHQIDELVKHRNTYYFGSIYDDWAKINQSYIEAISCRDYYAYRLENRNIYAYQQLPNKEEQDVLYQLDTGMIVQLENALADGNEEISRQAIETLLTASNTQTLPPYLLKSLCFEILNTMIKTANKMNVTLEPEWIKNVVNASTLFTIMTELQQLAHFICEKVKANATVEESQMKHDIFAYIHEHFRSHDFSLEELALEFDFSVSYLSKLIKEETGETFSKHVQQLRLDYIQQQLIETDDTIKVIIHDAGYYDVSNFTRKFRQLVGVTPGQYRLLNQKKEN